MLHARIRNIIDILKKVLPIILSNKFLLKKYRRIHLNVFQ